MILVFHRKKEVDIIKKIVETVREKVTLSMHTVYTKEDRRPTMHPEEDQPVLYRPIMNREEDQPALHWLTMHQEEDHWRPMHLEGDKPAKWVYGVNCASVVGISRSTTLFSSLLSHSAYYVRFLFFKLCVCYLMPLWFLAGTLWS